MHGACTLSFTSTRCDSKRVKDKGAGEQRDDDTAGSELEQKFAALAVDESDAYDGHDALQHLDGDVAFGGVAGAHSRLFEDDHQEPQDRVDAGRLVAGEDHAGEDERDNVLPLNSEPCRADSASLRAVLAASWPHFTDLPLGFLFGRRSAQRGERLLLFAVTKEPARGFAEEERAEKENQSRIDDGEEHASPGVVGGSQNEVLIACGGGDGGFRLAGVEPADDGGEHDAEGEHELKDRGAPAAVVGAEAFGEVERHDDGDHAAAEALQQAAEEERNESLRDDDEADAQDKEQAADDHHLLAAEPVGEHPGDERREHASAEDSGDDDRGLLDGEVDGLVQIEQGGGDDADIDSVEQAAEAGDEDEEASVADE